MNNEILERELENFDYSMIHPVKEKILVELLEMQRETKKKTNITRSIALKRIDLDSLNLVAAAGDASVEGADFTQNSTPFIHHHPR